MYYLLTWDPLRCHSCRCVLIISCTSLCLLGGGGCWIRCTHRGCDEFIIFGTHKEDISFIHCLIFSLSRSLDKLLLTQVVLDQALSEPFKCYLVLVNSKKKPVWPTKKTTAYILFLYSKYLLPTRLKQEKVQEPTIIRE